MIGIKKAAYHFDSTGSSLGDDVEEIEDDDLGDDAFITFKTAETRCEELYHRGMKLKSQKELEDALSCFLECLKGMQECQYFAKLPQTLHELADVYRNLERFDEAAEFAKTEKLFYEAATVDLQDGGASRISNSSKLRDDPAEYGDLLIRKADDFEHLARVSAKEKKFVLAVDSCRKAVKIRQTVFGPEHLITTATLEYLTVLYADVGRAEYEVVMQQLKTPPETVKCDTPSLNKSASVCMEQSKDSLPSQVGQKVQECHDSSCETLPSTDKESHYHWNHKLSCGQSSSTFLENKEIVSRADTTETSTVTRLGVVRIFKSTPLWLLIFALIIQVLLLTFLF